VRRSQAVSSERWGLEEKHNLVWTIFFDLPSLAFYRSGSDPGVTFVRIKLMPGPLRVRRFDFALTARSLLTDCTLLDIIVVRYPLC